MRKNFLKKAGLLSFCAALIMNVGTTFAAPTDVAVVQKALEEEKAAAFPVGVYNARNVDHFTGDSYVAPLSSIGPMAGGMRIHGGKTLHGAEIDSYLDHRIAMSFAVAALAADGVTSIKDADCVKISYPNFYDDLLGLAK